ncbi:MAG: holo-ACP synthase [Candidatus Binatia bacterium]
MIVGVGIDIVAVARIREALERVRTGARFRARVFTPEEVAYCGRRRNAHESYAARFAAKEATMKALGRGFGEGLAWRDIEVVRATGAPSIRLVGDALIRAQALGVSRLHLSLTHEGDLAVACVIAES